MMEDIDLNIPNKAPLHHPQEITTEPDLTFCTTRIKTEHDAPTCIIKGIQVSVNHTAADSDEVAALERQVMDGYNYGAQDSGVSSSGTTVKTEGKDFASVDEMQDVLNRNTAFPGPEDDTSRISSCKPQPTVNKINVNSRRASPKSRNAASSRDPSNPNRENRRNSYTICQKKLALRMVSQKGIQPTARILQIPPTTLKTWKLQFGYYDPSMRSVGGVAPHHPGVEEQLYAWILVRQDLQLPVNRQSIAEKAQQLVNNPDFKASSGWLDRFSKRYKLKLSSPSKSSAARQLPADLQNWSKIFLQQVEEICTEHKLDKDCIVSMDETALFLGLVSGTPAEKNLAREAVRVNTRYLTVILAITASGVVLSPLVIFKGKQYPADIDKVPDGIHVVMHPDGCMTESIMQSWIARVLSPYTQRRRCLLVLDSFAGHTAGGVIKDLEGINAIPAFIPAGCASKIQPIEASIDKPFKDHLHHFWTAYMQHPSKSKLKKIQAARRQDILEWIHQARNRVSEQQELIRKSFYDTGLLGGSGCGLEKGAKNTCQKVKTLSDHTQLVDVNTQMKNEDVQLADNNTLSVDNDTQSAGDDAQLAHDDTLWTGDHTQLTCADT